MLRNSHISFHTTDNDKDSDTHVIVTLIDSDGVVAARISDDFGHFDDNSENGPYALKVLNPTRKDILQNGDITIRIDPKGHDTWDFDFFLDMTFSDGTRLSGGADGLEMSEGRRFQSFGVDGIVR